MSHKSDCSHSLVLKELAILTWKDDHKQPEVAVIQIDWYVVRCFTNSQFASFHDPFT